MLKWVILPRQAAWGQTWEKSRKRDAFFAGDNGGPQSQKQAEANIASALKIFPNARVIGAEEKERKRKKAVFTRN
jgi:hypothetical protein